VQISSKRTTHWRATLTSTNAPLLAIELEVAVEALFLVTLVAVAAHVTLLPGAHHAAVAAVFD